MPYLGSLGIDGSGCHGSSERRSTLHTGHRAMIRRRSAQSRAAELVGPSEVRELNDAPTNDAATDPGMSTTPTRRTELHRTELLLAAAALVALAVSAIPAQHDGISG